MDRLLVRIAQVLAVGALSIALSIGAANAQTDSAAGQAAFRSNCAVCHMAVSNGHTLIGPNLFGVVGRHAASTPGFAYSPAMQHSGITWTTSEIATFIQAPSRTVPGTRMTFAGVHNPQQADAIAAYLSALH
jgi:cytochrome c